MKTITLNVKASQDAKAQMFNVRFPETIEEATKRWGEASVYALLTSAATVRLQSVARSCIDAKKSKDETEKTLSDFKPQVRQAGKPKAVRAKELLDQLDPETRAMLLAEAAKTTKPAPSTKPANGSQREARR